MRQHPFELGHLLLQLQFARLRLLRDALEPPLDMIPIGNQQLEPQRLQVVGGNPGAREAVEDDEQRIHLAQIPQQLGPGAPHLDDSNRRGRDLAGLDHAGDLP